jgi:hypothetical protein
VVTDLGEVEDVLWVREKKRVRGARLLIYVVVTLVPKSSSFHTRKNGRSGACVIHARP